MFTKESDCNQSAIPKLGQDKFTSETIDLIRFPLAVMVVFIHSDIHPNETFMMPSDYAHLSGMDWHILIRSFCSHVFSHIAVPAFFLISGYLFYKRLESWDWNIWKKKMFSRLRTLVIPYFIWCVLYVLWRNIGVFYIQIPLFKFGAVILKGKPLNGIVDYLNSIEINNIDWYHVLWDSQVWGGECINWFGLHAVHNTGPELFPFWFMRDLIVVVLLTPIVFYSIKRIGFYFICIIGFFYFSGIWPDIHGFSSTALFYFSLGSWFTLKKYDLCKTLYPFRWYFYITYMVLLPLMVYLDGKQTYGGKSVYVLIGVLTLLCFNYYLVKEKGIRKSPLLVSSCFFMFAFHIFILLDVYGNMNKVIGNSSPFQLNLLYLITPIATVIVCVCIYYCIHRWFPSVCRVLTGGR